MAHNSAHVNIGIPLPALVLDTAGPILSVTVLGPQGTELAFFREYVWRDMAEQLHPAVAHVLEEAKTPFSALKSVCVNVGPGSFTSVRIGLATAKAYAFALAIPVYGASGFEAMAHPYFNKAESIGVWLEATAGEVYYQYFSAEGTPLGAPSSALPEVALAHAPKGVTLVGNVIFEQLICNKAISQTDCMPKTYRVDAARAEGLACVALENALTPLYVRALKYKKQSA